MPLTMFKCPDSETRLIKTCLDYCPRTNGRCLSLPTLHEIGSDREWKGVASTTMLLNPTRMSYLKIVHDYAIDPFDRAFALLGTRHHKKLEIVASKIIELHAEIKIVGETSSIIDLLEPDELKDGYWKLTDYKTWGSYALAKVTGVKDNGDYELKQAGLQLNDYRIKAQDIGFPISRLFIQCTVRDGGTFTARNNGIDYKMALIPIEIMDDDKVKEYFITKEYALQTALKENTLPELCPYDERWSGRRCKGFCDVFMFCPEGAKVNKIEYQE